MKERQEIIQNMWHSPDLSSIESCKLQLIEFSEKHPEIDEFIGEQRKKKESELSIDAILKNEISGMEEIRRLIAERQQIAAKLIKAPNRQTITWIKEELEEFDEKYPFVKDAQDSSKEIAKKEQELIDAKKAEQSSVKDRLRAMGRRMRKE